MATRNLLRALLPLALLSGLSGCGQEEPGPALRELGATIEYNERGRPAEVDLPDDAGDEALQHVARLKRLQRLDASGTQITDTGLEALKEMERLEVLDLRNTRLTDQAMAVVAEINGLRVLNIGGTAVTDAGLGELKAVASLETLSVATDPKPLPPRERSWRDAINLGIDLAGGTNLVYQIDREKTEKEVTSEVMAQMVAAVSRRVNPSGTEEVTVRQVGNDRIEVIIPGADPETVSRMKAQIVRLGSLEFALLANRRDHDDVIRRAEGVERNVLRPDGTVEAGWREVAKTSDGEYKEIGDRHYVVSRVRPGERGEQRLEYLVVFEQPEQRITGDYLLRARPSTDETGRPAVEFTFDQRGGYRFQTLTSQNRPTQDGHERRLAILLDDMVHQAPSIRTTISDRGQITGLENRAEVEELISVLNAGALAVPINPNPINEFSISPTLGLDVQEAGINAVIWSGLAVVAFMLAYYMWAGLVAVLCLILNLILLMGAMAFIDATFTLPGIAGIVLTIGMAVDANVLIFERMREELNRGSSLRMAIKNGFDKAFSAIIDANVTTLITAVILYMIGTDQVRGFAVTLFIGILVSMFTALYFGRMMFDIFERKRWLRTLKMFSFVGATNFNFLNKWKPAIGASLVVIVGGMAALGVRGSDVLDIDFSGGTMVTFEFREPHSIEEVRDPLQEKFGAAITLERLMLAEEEGLPSDTGKRFRLRVKEQNVPQVRADVSEALTAAGLNLKFVTMDYDAIEPIPSAGEDESLSFDDRRFAGGHRLPVRFSEEIRTGTASVNFATALAAMTIETEGGQTRQKYEDPEAFFEFAGTRGSGTQAEATDVLRFDEMVLRTSSELPREDLQTALDTMQRTMAREPQFEEVNSFASAVATEMQQSALLAILASLLAIIGYLWYRFERVEYGLSAVVAVVHDVAIVLGMVALAYYLGIADYKINLPTIAAFLTIIGYSLNDTIVIFDRVREVRGKNPNLTGDMINAAMNQTLSRTILTSVTTLIVVAIMYFLGGEGIEAFAYCLVVGVIVGSYSTIFIASPFLLWMSGRTRGAARPVATASARTAAASR